MKDKIKGLVVGALIGTAITGTAAYASSTAQIEVLFRPLTILFDGVEKAPTKGTPFIYEGSTYVPLRFISETLGKEVGWNDETGTITIDEPGAGKVLASYKDGDAVYTITQARLNKQMAISQLYTPYLQSYVNDPGFIEQTLQELAVYLIAAGRADDGILEAALSEVPARLELMKASFEGAYQGSMDWTKRLNELKLTEKDLQEHLRLNYIRTAYLKSLVSEDQLRTAYDDAVAAHDYDVATVRHVLVGFETEDGKTRTKEEALKRAKEVQSKLAAGAAFADIALAYSDDPGSKDQGGRYENQSVGQWVTGFRDAVVSQKLGTVGDPVETEYGYHVILVESRTTPPFEDLREELLSRELDTVYMNLATVELPRLRMEVPE